MKRTILMLVLVLAVFKVNAQGDVIVRRNGYRITDTKVIEHTATDIKYKQFYKKNRAYKSIQYIPKCEVSVIEYKNGNREEFVNGCIIKSEDATPVTTISNQTGIIADDRIYLHNGSELFGSVLIVSDNTITYKYKGETKKHTVSKYAVSKIVYGQTSKIDNISNKVSVSSVSDWENVVIVYDSASVMGFKKVSEIKGHADVVSESPNSIKESDLKHIKVAAADRGCPLVLLRPKDKNRSSYTWNAIGYKY